MRISFIIKNEMFNLARENYFSDKIKSGEVINKILKGEIIMADEGKEKTGDAAQAWENEWERFRLVELADAVMKDILGINFRAIMAEKQKENPDIKKLNYLKEERRQLKAEQKQISFDDKEALHRYIDKYATIIKAHFANFIKKNQAVNESFKLDKKQHDAIYQKLEKEMLADSAPSAEPTIVIIGGQPGSGKLGLEKHIRETTFAGISPAVIDSNNYRKSHPQFEEIAMLDDKKMAERTNPDARLWTQELLHSAAKNRRDIILQGTMRNKETVMDIICRLKEQGYKVHIAGLAVGAESSRLGIQLMYEDQKQTIGYGRWVSSEFHDEAYKNFPETLHAIEHNSPAD